MVLCIVRETWIWIRWSQWRHTGTLGKIEEQESRPSGHGHTIMLPTFSFTWFVRWWDLDVGRLYAPDLTCVLCDGAVAGELSRSSNVSDDLFGPFFWVLRKRKGNFTHNEGQSKFKLKKSCYWKTAVKAVLPVCPFIKVSYTFWVVVEWYIVQVWTLVILTFSAPLWQIQIFPNTFCSQIFYSL